MANFSQSILCLTILLLLTIIGGILFHRKLFSQTLIVILIATAFLKCYCASDQYLHEWDERYHALVAKNLIQHPLKPTLYDSPVEPYDYKNWVGNHIWLSKPPIPLWFMAFSIHIFGTHEYAVRLPGIIFSILSVLLTYRIALSLFSTRTAVIAAALHGVHGMLTDLASGRLSSDGVETCFLFFVSFGMFLIFKKNQGTFKPINYAIVGFVTGISFMCKWQPALLILVIMFVYHFDKMNWQKHILYSSFSFFITVLTCLPWAMYCFTQFPTEANWMSAAMFHPMHIVIPGNDGTWYSYITDFGKFFGYSTFILMGIAFATSVSTRNRIALTLFIWIALPLFIFSLAEIKRGTYLMIAAPSVFLLLAHFLTDLNILNRYKKATRILAVISVLSIIVYSIEKLYLFSNNKSRTRDWSIRIKELNPAKGTVIYNEPHCIEMMFYHDVTAYEFPKKTPSE